MGSSRVRISDIAEELGLSTATVSNVIHGKTKKISDETVKRVQELLEKREYIPSMAEILLAQNDSKIIGVVIHDHPKYEGHTIEDNFISASVNALAKELDMGGYFLMLKLTTEIKDILRFASMWNMVGLILMGFCDQDYQKLREQMHIPLVVYDGFSTGTGGLVNIESDHYMGGVRAGKYLKSKGHQNAACISDNDICMDLLRYEGLKSVFPEAELIQIPYETHKRNIFYQENLQKFLCYSAVFAVSDYYAIDLMNFLIEQGIKVPEQISIIGFDDIRTAALTKPALTTIHQDHQTRAKLALDMLIKMKNKEACPQNIKLDVSVAERESVKEIVSLHKIQN